MDEIERIKEDVRQGRISAERLIEVILSQQRELEAAKRRLAGEPEGPPMIVAGGTKRPTSLRNLE